MLNELHKINCRNEITCPQEPKPPSTPPHPSRESHRPQYQREVGEVKRRKWSHLQGAQGVSVSANVSVNVSTRSCLCKVKEEAPANREGGGGERGAGVRLLETVSEPDSNSCKQSIINTCKHFHPRHADNTTTPAPCPLLLLSCCCTCCAVVCLHCRQLRRQSDNNKNNNAENILANLCRVEDKGRVLIMPVFALLLLLLPHLLPLSFSFASSPAACCHRVRLLLFTLLLPPLKKYRFYFYLRLRQIAQVEI